MHAFAADAAAFYSRGEKRRRQERYEFQDLPKALFSETMQALLEISSGKCVYCETPMRYPGSASLDRFRPKAGALDQNGRFSTEHYWWLAYEWRNLYPCCARCNRLKGSKFPMNGPRVAPGTPYDELVSEPRLLLDPFHDEPLEHLAFRNDGTVTASSVSGEATIATLELNRSELRSSRKKVAKATQDLLREWRAKGGGGASALARLGESLEGQSPAKGDLIARRLASLLQIDAPHAAVARALVRAELANRGSSSATSAGKGKGAVVRPVRTPNRAATARSQRERSWALRSQFITRVAVKNFRGLSDLDLELATEASSGAPWTVLLGENGTGKSSLLQAIALALLPGHRTPAVLSSARMLRKGARRGFVRVWLQSSEAPRELSFEASDAVVTRTGPEYKGILLGYGATRLLPRRAGSLPSGFVRLENMFNPFYPLLDAARWLGALEKPAFDYAARALKDALELPRSAILGRARNRTDSGVTLRLFGAEVSLEELSDGYQSVLGLTCDVMAGLRKRTKGAIEATEAIVLIDELGAHLHPRWRMRIIGSLRRAFPRTQFLASTHDPLCLRGLEDREAIVLRRTSRGRVYPVPDLPPLKGLRVDQLLTSEYFGLDSTLDPAIERSYRELYRLLALRDPTPAQVGRIGALREELAPYDLPGATRRERRLLQIIDSELAQVDETPELAKRDQVRAESEILIAALLNPSSSGSPTT